MKGLLSITSSQARVFKALVPAGPRSSICSCHAVRKLRDGSSCSDTADRTFKCTHGRLLLAGAQGPNAVEMALYNPEEIIRVSTARDALDPEEPMASSTKSPCSEAS